MCMDTSNLFKKNSDIGDMLTRSALSDRSILTEMFKYFSISDLQYFLKNGLVFHSNLNFLISKFLSIKFVLHFNVQMTGSVSKAGTILPQNSTCKILQPYGASLVGYNFSHLH